jgi:hypothetical protein
MLVTYFAKRIRVPLIASALAFLLFAFPTQTLELYSELTQELDARNLYPLGIAAVSIAILGAVIWFCTDSLLTEQPPADLPIGAESIYGRCCQWRRGFLPSCQSLR